MSDPEMTTFGMYPNWGVEYCKSYAEQLRDKTRANRAEHAADCIEYLLSLVQKEWVALTDDEVDDIGCDFATLGGDIEGKNWFAFYLAIEAKLKEKNK
jgi:hypothetical protein